jgi:hypothetical protein
VRRSGAPGNRYYEALWPLFFTCLSSANVLLFLAPGGRPARSAPTASDTARLLGRHRAASLFELPSIDILSFIGREPERGGPRIGGQPNAQPHLSGAWLQPAALAAPLARADDLGEDPRAERVGEDRRAEKPSIVGPPRALPDGPFLMIEQLQIVRVQIYKLAYESCQPPLLSQAGRPPGKMWRPTGAGLKLGRS